MCAPQECSPCALSRCSVTDNVRRKSLESIWGTATHSLSNNQCISTAFPFFNLQLTPSQSNCRASTDLPISLACHTACQSPQISRAKFNKVLFSTLNMLTAWLISLDRTYDIPTMSTLEDGSICQDVTSPTAPPKAGEDAKVQSTFEFSWCPTTSYGTQRVLLTCCKPWQTQKLNGFPMKAVQQSKIICLLCLLVFVSPLSWSNVSKVTAHSLLAILVESWRLSVRKVHDSGLFRLICQQHDARITTSLLQLRIVGWSIPVAACLRFLLQNSHLLQKKAVLVPKKKKDFYVSFKRFGMYPTCSEALEKLQETIGTPKHASRFGSPAFLVSSPGAKTKAWLLYTWVVSVAPKGHVRDQNLDLCNLCFNVT